MFHTATWQLLYDFQCSERRDAIKKEHICITTLMRHLCLLASQKMNVQQKFTSIRWSKGTSQEREIVMPSRQNAAYDQQEEDEVHSLLYVYQL
jgi:hypothetical protein